MAERDGVDGSAEELDRVLSGEDIPAGSAHDPLVVIAAALHDLLPQETPSAEFRARLKAELLERHANNVREFPAVQRPLLLPDEQPGGRQRRRFGVAALATSAAAAAAVLLGIGATHLKDQSHPPPVAQVYHDASATPTPLPTQSALPGTATVSSTPVVPSTPVARGGNPENPPPAPVVAPQFTPTAPAAPTTSIVAQHLPTQSTPTIVPMPPSATATATFAYPSVPEATATTAAPGTSQPEPTAAASDTPGVVESLATPGPTLVAQVYSSPQPALQSTATAPAASPTEPPAPPTSTSPAVVAPKATATSVGISDTAAATATPVIVPSLTPVVQPTHTPKPIPPTVAPKPTSTAIVVPSVTPATGSQNGVPPTATQPAATNTPAVVLPAATASATDTAVPEASATDVPTSVPSATVSAAPDTPVPPSDATATVAPPPATFSTQPTLVAQVQVTGTPVKHTVAANQANATSTPVPGPQFPLPSVAAAPANSPLNGLQPLAPGVKLHADGLLPTDPGLLPVIAPISHDVAARQILLGYGFKASALRGQTDSTSTAAISTTVSLGRLQYSAVLTAESYGYSLSLRLLSQHPAAATHSATFDAQASASAFLHTHGLDENLQSTGAQTVSGVTTVTFTTYLSNTFTVADAGATLSYSATGVLTGAEIHMVDDSTAPTVSGISAEAALAGVFSGGGMVKAAPGVVVDASSTVTDATIVYLPLSAGGGTYLEPLYRFTGLTADNQPFEVYAPAIDRAYLR